MTSRVVFSNFLPLLIDTYGKFRLNFPVTLGVVVESLVFCFVAGVV